MATLRKKIQVEQAMRELLERNDVPEPDRVEYGYECVRLFFERPRVCLIIDIDEPGNTPETDIAEIEETSADAELN